MVQPGSPRPRTASGVFLVGLVGVAALGGSFLTRPAAPGPAHALPVATESGPLAKPAVEAVGEVAAPTTDPPDPPPVEPARPAGSRGLGRIAGTDGAGARLRVAPDGGAEAADLLDEGTLLFLLGEPQTDGNGREWQQVEAPGDGWTGWVASAYVRPIPVPDRPGAAADPDVDPALQAVVEAAIANRPGVYSVVIEALADGRRASVRAEREIEAASIYKLFVMYEVFRQERLGRFRFDAELTVTDRAAGLSLGGAAPVAGSAITVRSALERMVQLSDNTCAVLLGDLVGWTRMRDALREIGIRRTEFWPELRTTAGDVAQLLRLIAADEAIDPAASEAMLEIMLGQRRNDRLPKGLPEGVRIGHKTGELDGFLHDAGIVEAPFGRYVVVVLSEGGTFNAFADLARLGHAVLADPSISVTWEDH